LAPLLPASLLPALSLLGLLLAMPAGAAEPTGEALPQRQARSFEAAAAAPAQALHAASGTRTEQWLRLQAQGLAASAHPQQASPAERELANQRLLDSYGHPIPEYLPRTVTDDTSESE
jgi:hypothetical protein